MSAQAIRQQQDMMEIITRVQGGDRQAYSELYEHFRPSVYTLALAYVREPQAAQELTHDVLVHAFLKLHQLRQPVAFVGWLRQMTARMALNRISRRSPCSGETMDTLDDVMAPSASPLEQLLSHEQTSQVRQSLARLKPMDRDTLWAFYYEEQSIESISQRCAAPLGTIKRRLHVARKRLQAELASTR
ncbi:MAG: sigma-70 family RNA polymerase sigma factor [Candidatus Tectomicrobia bacterium]|uniref:Sigma-70 family RNA polymerase sigma factor n=1 Tax=Tectimicrobiota bacterium TaxID=2528274 RepID=A0A937W7J4_UNCTE|nr:sigma-70 family RNA polymerase sigma factor [Candidatus Tectomicrobia bacterium]